MEATNTIQGNLTTSLKTRRNEAIELDNLLTIGQTGRHPERTSTRYGFIPTHEVIEVIKDQGLYPVAAREANVRNEENAGYQKHMVTFRFARDLGRLFDVADEIPQLLLVNSHMGSASFQLKLSLFRCVCKNQLVVSSSVLADIRIGHSPRAPQLVAEGIDAIVRVLPGVHDQVERFKAIELDPAERLAFADAALPLRFDADTHDVAPDDLLRLHRTADREPTLWNTFNVVQENIIRGGVRTVSRETRRAQRSRQVGSLTENLRLNTALWTLAERMAALKAGH